MGEAVVNPNIQQWAHLLPNQHCTLSVDSMGNHEWTNPEGLWHRVDDSGHQDGPAWFSHDGTQFWAINNRYHRVDGPAVIWDDAEPEWWLDDKMVTPVQWAADPRVIEVHSRTPQEAESWLARL